jgi:hypothetical protein
MRRYAIDPVTLVRLVDEGVSLGPDLQLVGPNPLRSDALAILLSRTRDGRTSERAALELHERMTELRIRLLGDRVSRRTAWGLAVANDWDDLRDAEYLAVARLQADALVAGDPRLAERAAGIVEVVDFAVLRA